MVPRTCGAVSMIVVPKNITLNHKSRHDTSSTAWGNAQLVSKSKSWCHAFPSKSYFPNSLPNRTTFRFAPHCQVSTSQLHNTRILVNVISKIEDINFTLARIFNKEQSYVYISVWYWVSLGASLWAGGESHTEMNSEFRESLHGSYKGRSPEVWASNS